MRYAIVIEKTPNNYSAYHQIYPDVQPQALPLRKYSSKLKKQSNFT